MSDTTHEITAALLRFAEELKAIREGMATREDVLNLWNLRQDMPTKADLWKLEQAIGNVIDAKPAKQPDNRMQDRFDTVSGRLLDRVETLESQVKAIWQLLRPKGSGETRTRSDTGASSESVAIAACLRACAQTILENNLGACGAAEYLDKYAETVIAAASRNSGGSGIKPVVPATDSNGTEQPPENYGYFKDKPDEK